MRGYKFQGSRQRTQGSRKLRRGAAGFVNPSRICRPGMKWEVIASLILLWGEGRGRSHCPTWESRG